MPYWAWVASRSFAAEESGKNVRMRTALAALLLLVAFGCQPTEPAEAAKAEPAATPTAPAPTAAAPGGGGGIAPIGSGAAGGMTPVTGAESVRGAGMGGIGQAAKDQARRAAGAAQNAPITTDGE